MAVESLDQDRRRQSDSTLPSMFPSNFEQAVREGEQFHRRHPSSARDSISAASPVSPTSIYAPSTSFSSKFQPSTTPSAPFATPPDSRKNSEDEKRHSIQTLPSLHEVGLAPGPPSHSSSQMGYSVHSHPTLPPVHPPGPNHALPTAQNGSSYQSSHPPPPLVRPSESRYDYDRRNSYGQYQPSPVHPNSEPYPSRSGSYSHTPQSYPPPPPPLRTPSHPSISGPPPPPQTPGAQQGPPTPNQHNPYQFGHGPSASQQAPPQLAQPNPQPYQHNMQPPQYSSYSHDSNSTHSSGYQGGSPSKVLGKRPSTGYGGAIERALQVSSMRRDLENSRSRSASIYNLVQHLYEQNGSRYHGLEVVLNDFNKAVQDANELKEGLEGCRRLLADMCKSEQEQQLADKTRSHIPDYEVEDPSYPEDIRTSGMQPPELKKMRRGRAAPPGRCHSCHRAETPEWRRGPDGARTLCNACGLHYAKLTRKMSKSNLVASAMARKSPNSSLA